MAYVADGENARNICLEQKRIAIERPTLGAAAFPHEIWPRQQETTIVTLHEVSQPVSSRKRANKNEHRIGFNPLNFICIRTQNRNFFNMRFAMNLGDAGIRPH